MPGPSSHTSLSCSFPGVVPLFPFIAGTVPWLDSSWGLVEKWFLGIPPAGSWDPGTGILGSFTHRELEGGGQFKPPLRQKFGRIRNMKSSLQWERRQRRGRIYSSNGQKFVVTRKKLTSLQLFGLLAGIKHIGFASHPASAYFGEVETTQDVPFAFGMHLDLKQSSIQDRQKGKSKADSIQRN